jgi:hypothetical protein
MLFSAGVIHRQGYVFKERNTHARKIFIPGKYINSSEEGMK